MLPVQTTISRTSTPTSSWCRPRPSGSAIRACSSGWSGATAHGARVGLIIDGALDVPGIIAAYDPAQIELTGEQDAAAINGVPLAYRNACYDAVFLLRRFRSILDPYERHMTGDGEAGRERLEELVFACLERLLPEWRALWRIAHQGLKPVLDDPAMVRATKQFTEAVVTPELIRGPIWRQSYDKPFGYPGDYQVMNYIYDGDNANNGEVVGETAFARLVD